PKTNTRTNELGIAFRYERTPPARLQNGVRFALRPGERSSPVIKTKSLRVVIFEYLRSGWGIGLGTGDWWDVLYSPGARTSSSYLHFICQSLFPSPQSLVPIPWSLLSLQSNA